MNKIYDKDGIVLYQGDIINVLPSINNVSVVISDPPFNVGKVFDRDITDDEYYLWCDQWIDLCWKCISQSGSFFLMTIQSHIGNMMMSLKKSGYFRNQIIWHNSSMPVKNKFCIGYQPILWYVKSIDNYIFNYGAEKRQSSAVLPWGKTNKSHSIKDIWDDIPFISGGCMASKESILLENSKKKAHPTQMPIRLAERMIKYCSNEGDLILDPFCGSGTTLVAAKNLNRRAIGVEISENYCNLIIQRLENTSISHAVSNTSSRQGIDLFDDEKKV